VGIYREIEDRHITIHPAAGGDRGWWVFLGERPVSIECTRSAAISFVDRQADGYVCWLEFRNDYIRERDELRQLFVDFYSRGTHEIVES
jgi:hypothetical protein